MSAQFESILIGTMGLSLSAIAAFFLALRRGALEDIGSRRQVIRLALVGTSLHIFHSYEETLTSFYRRFPEQFGLEPWPPGFFISFNLVCVASWLGCLPFAKSHRVALAPIWFLAIASVLNLVAHPFLALRVAGYFPGLWTSPLVGILGLMLVRVLLPATRRRESTEPEP